MASQSYLLRKARRLGWVRTRATMISNLGPRLAVRLEGRLSVLQHILLKHLMRGGLRPEWYSFDTIGPTAILHGDCVRLGGSNSMGSRAAEKC